MLSRWPLVGLSIACPWGKAFSPLLPPAAPPPPALGMWLLAIYGPVAPLWLEISPKAKQGPDPGGGGESLAALRVPTH